LKAYAAYSNSELSISTSALRVDNTLRNTLTIEMCQQVNQMEVLKKKRTIRAESLESLGILDGTAIGSRVDWLLGVFERRRGLVVCDHDCVSSRLKDKREFKLLIVQVFNGVLWE